MPELPDVTVYCEALATRVRGEVPRRVEMKNPFVLRTAVPPIASAEGRQVLEVRRLGKRVVLAGCQTGGVILADRALSRLLHDSFPRMLEEG